MIVLSPIAYFWYTPIAAVFVLGGLGLLLWNARLDRIYGTDRPTKKEIGKMPREEYRRKILDLRFRKWVEYEVNRGK